MSRDDGKQLSTEPTGAPCLAMAPALRLCVDVLGHVSIAVTGPEGRG